MNKVFFVSVGLFIGAVISTYLYFRGYVGEAHPALYWMFAIFSMAYGLTLATEGSQEYPALKSQEQIARAILLGVFAPIVYTVLGIVKIVRWWRNLEA